METQKNQAMAHARDLGISTKQSIELCNFIRNKNVAKAKSLLEEVMQLKTPVPYRRFKRNIPHQKVIGPGRYPAKAAEEVLKLLKSAESNAKAKGLENAKLFVKSAIANKGSNSYHAGRIRGLKKKRTHLSLVIEERRQGEKNNKP